MHRIDKRGNIANRFTVGNPAAGQAPTVLGADWPNAVQEELCHVIEQAGLALNKESNQQLYEAILAIASGVIGEPGEEGSVPTTRSVGTAGLATGGGALATNLTINVPKATGAEIATGADDTKAITPAGLVAAMGSVKSTIGYTKLFNGLIMMWGQASATGNGTTIITLPTTFPNACLWAGVEGGAIDDNAQDNSPFVSGKGTGSLSIYNAQDGSRAINWFAFGH